MTCIEIKRDYNGHFSAYVGGARSDYYIVNGSLGVSGRGRNMYGICHPEKAPKWIGSLASAKKILTHWLQKSCAPTTQA